MKKQKIYGGHFDIPSKKEEIILLNQKVNSSNFWENQKSAEQTLKELNSIKSIVEPLDNLKSNVETSLELLEIVETLEELNQLENEIKEYNEEYEKLSLLLLLNGPYDKNDCILEIHSGAGGTEACDWANMLLRMYTRYCEKHGFKVIVLDMQDGEEAGIKSCSLEIKGENAYGYLKNEKGVHRLVRLSPFDSNNRRHTSFASVEVTPKIDNTINIDINEKDLKIDVYRSSGKGGQGVNTTDSAVRITHLPTKIVVTCQNERSQIQNKETAVNVLKSKLIVLEEEKRKNQLNDIKGEVSNIEFGSQIRSYVLHPYSMIKDHRTNTETSNTSKVLDGDIDIFIEDNLKRGK
ncbi:MAG: peptide chain release factor 2 [Bacilli bacterium]|nr:peptide chain release factor 2 [Bacilli bacterium]